MGVEFSVRFWGVRGSIACPGPETVRYGGNTSCIEMRVGGHLLIFDAGTGLRALGNNLMKQAAGGRIDCDLFYSHTHFDHICGLPFFGPVYGKGNSIRMWAGHLLPDNQLENVLCGLMMAPLFPVPMGMLSPQIDFRDFECGAVHHVKPDVTVRTGRLNHPNGACGYRVEHGGKTVCYITDTEHRPGGRDQEIVKLVRDSDFMIYDATYTDDEYPRYVNWGHSTWQEGCRIADEANVKTLVIFHHDPGHDDGFMDRIAAEAQAARPGTLVAVEGMVLTP